VGQTAGLGRMDREHQARSVHQRHLPLSVTPAMQDNGSAPIPPGKSIPQTCREYADIPPETSECVETTLLSKTLPFTTFFLHARDVFAHLSRCNKVSIQVLEK
jgi:hypothetical protein